MENELPNTSSGAHRRRTTKLSAEKTQKYVAAYTAVKNGELSVHSAAKQWGLCKTTLRNWCQKSDLDERPKVGRLCFIGNLIEDKLEKWALDCAKSGE